MLSKSLLSKRKAAVKKMRAEKRDATKKVAPVMHNPFTDHPVFTGYPYGVFDWLMPEGSKLFPVENKTQNSDNLFEIVAVARKGVPPYDFKINAIEARTGKPFEMHFCINHSGDVARDEIIKCSIQAYIQAKKDKVL